MNDGSFCRLGGDDLIEAARVFETLSRLALRGLVLVADEMAAQQTHTRFGAASTAALLRQSLLLSEREARQVLAVARQVAPQDAVSGGEVPVQLPVLAHAMSEGEVGAEQMSIVVRGLTSLPAAIAMPTRAAAEEHLVGYARQLDPRRLDKVVAYLHTALDPDGSLDERDPRARMELHIGPRDPRTKLTPMRGLLDDHTTAMLTSALEWFARPEPGCDGQPDPRTPATRLGQAFTELLDVFLAGGFAPSRHGESAHITVHLNWDHMNARAGTATYDTGTPVDPKELRRLLCDADLLPVTLTSAGEIKDVGSRKRFFSCEQRKAITARDRGCSFPGCDRPPAWCDTHHVAWYTRDLGETSVENGALLCPFHHHLIHQGDWTARMTPTGPEYTPPGHVDPSRTPRRNTLHHPPLLAGLRT